MRKGNQKILTVVTASFLILCILFFVFLLINNNRKENKSITPKNDLTGDVLDTLVSTSTPPTEDDDVFRQRQLRADFNEGSPNPDY